MQPHRKFPVKDLVLINILQIYFCPTRNAETKLNCCLVAEQKPRAAETATTPRDPSSKTTIWLLENRHGNSIQLTLKTAEKIRRLGFGVVQRAWGRRVSRMWVKDVRHPDDAEVGIPFRT